MRLDYLAYWTGFLSCEERRLTNTESEAHDSHASQGVLDQVWFAGSNQRWGLPLVAVVI